MKKGKEKNQSVGVSLTCQARFPPKTAQHHRISLRQAKADSLHETNDRKKEADQISILRELFLLLCTHHLQLDFRFLIT